MSLLCRPLRFLYVRVPRTGSTTYVHYLTRAFHVEQIAEQHAGLRRIRETNDLDGIRTYGFIRNPWDWMVSMYDSGVSATPDVKEAWQGRRTDGRNRVMPFDEYVHQRITTPMDWLMGCDDIFRFEDFRAGWDVKLSSAPGSPRDGYRDWYDDYLAEYVASKCRAEIDMGGYEF